ncbi:hypothetical protein VNI00_003799 [Paramarasmius palmivorus]|uniref:ubiquitinyl hydrolase 1 n=1 Tax=Paramarasmius palmivorus TaxID=297713 RepID=A0AAW0DN65_9AGAR
MADSHHLPYVINHVFLPPKLPQHSDESAENYTGLCRTILHCAEEYSRNVANNERVRWSSIVRMLKRLCFLEAPGGFMKENVEACLLKMKQDDVLAFLIRRQNAGLIIRQFDKETVFESFEVSASNEDVMTTRGKLICSYPGPAIAVPTSTSRDPRFLSELANFLTQFNEDLMDDTAPATTKAGTKLGEIRDTVHPRYITELLTGILRGVGHPADVVRIGKRIADDVLWKDALLPWRRSPIWLLIRVALQTTLLSGTDHSRYKSFMAFAMAQILRTAVTEGLDSDLLCCMSKKVSRRLYKLGSAAPQFLTEEVLDAGGITYNLLHQRWHAEQKRHAKASLAGWNPSGLNILSDTKLSLRNSKGYISQALRNSRTRSSVAAFHPAEELRLLALSSYASGDVLTKAVQNVGVLALMDFEHAVENSIDTWILDNLDGGSACTILQGWIEEYSKVASKEYDGDPEAMSIMFLTLLELWVGLDKLATHQCPLLLKYSPEIAQAHLEPILLRQSTLRDRLKRVSQYVHNRQSHATHQESIFSGKITRDSFVVRYFDISPLHRSLKQRIESKATSDRHAKVQELHRLNKRHAELTRNASELLHSVDEEGFLLCKQGKKKKKGSQCTKCRLNKEAARLSIHVFEWPLPAAPLEAQATVVEMECPAPFSAWRDGTYYLLWDIWTPDEVRTTTTSGGPTSEKLLRDYRGLKGFITSGSTRLTFGSKTKSFLDSHYKKPPSIPSSEDRVCLKNALQFSLRDTLQNIWVSDPYASCTVWRPCTYQLPAGPYQNLQFAIDGTAHTPNEVLASQFDCHPEITLHEYIAFGSLRSGSRLQWLNILRELTSRQLAFQRAEVEMLILQSILQVGPLGSDSQWDWHLEIHDAQFCVALLGPLEALQNAIKLNWTEVVSLRIVVILATLVLSSCRDEIVAGSAFDLLESARNVAFGWMEQVAKRLRDNTADENLAPELQTRLSEIAALFRSTYDLDYDHQRVLFALDHHLSRFVKSGIILHDNLPTQNVPEYLSRLYSRDVRLTRLLQPLLKVAIAKNSRGFNDAIRAIWPSHNAASQWQLLPAPNDCWVCNVNDGLHQIPSIHYNLLDNSLLINGKPLSRLPVEYTNHATFSRLFGKVVLDVVPASYLAPNMDFVASNLISGNQVFFAMNGSELIVQIRSSGRHYELIPRHKFVGDLPIFLVDDYTHWLDLSEKVIELRPLNNIWNSDFNNWRMTVRGRRMWRPSASGMSQLVDIRSLSAIMLAVRLQALDHPHYLTTTFCEDVGLSVDVTRFRLSFQLDADGALACRNLPGMIVDDDQSAGVLIGLRDQLVLRDRKDKSKREVIVPIGEIQYSRMEGHHTTTTIKRDASRHAHYYRYQVDSTLGRLVSHVGIHGKLYQVYLHAVTSHCLPDPLTGRTGTEQALHELQSAPSRSFQTLDQDCQNILKCISTLTPRRVYYPPHLKHMQTVCWSELHPSSQHDEFAVACRAIMTLAHQLHAFIPKDKKSPSFDLLSDNTNLDLVTRAALRNSSHCPAESTHHTSDDSIYRSRDLTTDTTSTSQEALVHQDAFLVATWSSYSPATMHLLDVFKKWSILSGPQANISGHTLSYHRRWLDEDLASNWLTIYQILRTEQSHRYQTLFTFCTMGYGPRGTEFRELLPTLLAFATNKGFGGAEMTPPVYNSYDLSAGFVPEPQHLVAIARDTATSFAKSFAAYLPRQEAESKHDLASRQHSSYHHLLNVEVQKLVEAAVQQWPCKGLSVSSKLYKVANVEKFLEQARSLFAQWYRNRELLLFTCTVQDLLDRNQPANQDLKQLKLYYFQPSTIPTVTRGRPTSLNDLFLREAPLVDIDQELLSFHMHRSAEEPCDITSPISCLLGELRAGARCIESQYADDLGRSLRALRSDNPSMSSPHRIAVDTLSLQAYNDDCETQFREVWTKVRACLAPTTDAEIAILQSGLWPRLSVVSLLERLASANGGFNLAQEWHDALCVLARSILLLQRARRLCRLWHTGQVEDFWKEMEVPAAMIQLVEDPDWLLIQVDGDFLVRPVQFAVANEMISPPGMQNAVLQLNMGEGKSSVIIPMVAASVADRNRLARVIALKPLTAQMFSLLVQRLSGLTNRRILHLPFSRDVDASQTQVQVICDIHREAMAAQAILVMQPEHILSLMLMMRQTIWLMPVQNHSVDYQANFWTYNYGWTGTVVTSSMRVTRYCMYDISLFTPWEPSNRWNTARIGGQQRNSSFRLSGSVSCWFKANFLSRHGALLRISFPVYMYQHQASDSSKISAKGHRSGKTSSCFEGFWDMAFYSVPFRAKDVPSLKAEFGHPDIANLLTCLSYQYGGLDDDQVQLCFDMLYKLDNPKLEYEKWVAAMDPVPSGIRDLSSINMQDLEQRQHIVFPLFGVNYAVIDFYLSQVVFPKAAKEFPSKLGTSGWDLARRKANPTTGFSGTNDNRYLLPTSIIQQDTPLRLSTNARVLAILLQPSNNLYLCPNRAGGPSLSGRDIIDSISVNYSNLQIRVLLDVGAQILEMTNLEVAQYWLSRLSERDGVKAAIFFNDRDQLEVLTRDGMTELLMLSPYHQQINKCLVYLDDAHTRGTDLKLPIDWRACVTLGPKVTKDRLVQGCMRMRKLGQGQSVMFMAPCEVERAIRERCRIDDDEASDEPRCSTLGYR